MNYKKSQHISFIALHSEKHFECNIQDIVECLLLVCPIWWPLATGWPLKFKFDLIKMNWKFGCLVIWPIFQVPRATCGKWLLYRAVHKTLLSLHKVPLASAALDSWSFKLIRVWFPYLRKGKNSNSVLSCIKESQRWAMIIILIRGGKLEVRIDGVQMTGHLL